MTVRDVSKSDAPPTTYGTFEIQREQRVGKNSGTAYDQDLGRSPLSRWIAKAFDYSDFASNPLGATGNSVQLELPRGTTMLRCYARVDTAFVGTGNNDIDIGDAADRDGWNDGLDFSSTGGKYDPNAAYNPAGATGFRFYETGQTIYVAFKNATAPTAGEAIVFMEVISYHEDLSKEW